MRLPAFLRRCAWLCASLALADCATAPKSGTPPAAPNPPPLEASYDWHVLLLTPFGATLKEIPFGLHEVLLFKGKTHDAPLDDAECYAMEQPAPRFVAHQPQQYLVCFKHDRLVRIEVRVALTEHEAPLTFVDACELWRRNAGALAARAASGAAPDERPPCAGRDGPIAFAARLETDAERGEATLWVELFGPDL